MVPLCAPRDHHAREWALRLPPMLAAVASEVDVSNWTEEQLREWERSRNASTDAAAVAASDDNRPESAIQQECVKLMQEDGWRALRTDPVSDRTRGKGFGEVGMADYLFLRPGISYGFQVLWIEFKARKGKLSAAQEVWHRNERAKGFITWIASVDFPASVEGFREHYANSGLMQRACGVTK